MAIRINLLPWREELRQKRTKTTAGFLITGLLAGLLLSGLAFMYLSGQQTDYNNAIAKVNAETKKLKAKAKEKEKLIKLRTKITNQINAIDELQSKRATSTHVIEDFANAIPEDLFIRLFELKDRQVMIEGVAINDAEVSKLMVNIGNSEWFETPTLTYINREDGLPNESKVFKVTTKVINPEGESDGN